MNEKRQEVTPQEYERIKALLGADAEMFKRTKLGQYILDRCANASESAMRQLKKADPHDPKEIQHWQNEIWKNESFEIFLDDAISSGHLAMQNLERMEEADGEDDANYPPQYQTPPEEDDGEHFSPPELPGE